MDRDRRWIVAVGRGTHSDLQDADVARRVAARLPAGLAFFLGCVALSAGFEMVRFPDRRVPMAAFAAGFAVLAAGALHAVGRRPTAAPAIAIALVNVVGIALNAYHALVGASVAMCLWTLTGLIGSAAVILPWGKRKQALASAGALGAYPVHLFAGTADPLAWAAGAVYLALVTAMSVVGAARYERYLRTGLRLRSTLSEREARLQSYFDLASVGTAIVSADGRCREANDELCRITARRRVTLLGAHWRDLVHPADRERAATAFAAALAGRVEEAQELRVFRRDGTTVDVSVGLRGLPGPDGTIDHVIAVVHDVADRKRVESEREAALAHELAARQEAEAASRAKDAFLANVSHELRTPLSPILVWSDLLRRGTLDAEQTDRALAAIARNAGTQAQLIEDLLDVSRIVSGTLSLDTRPLDLVPVLRDAEDVIRPAARGKGVEIETRFDSDPCPVTGDADRLRQVFWNLLANAVKFTPAGGRVRMTLDADEDAARVAVADTGRGIDQDFLPHVFERFRQADPAASHPHGGLGIGLAIVRELVELHGGTVKAASDGEGHGATFTVVLPRAAHLPVAVVEDPQPPADEPPLDGVGVLVVDDDPDSNEVLRTLLTSYGADVRTAGSVADALELLGRWRPDVLVSDLSMPGEDGFALIARLRARGSRLPRVPAIALTAFAGPADRDHALAAGFEAHLRKPARSAELVRVIRATAGRRAS